MIDAVADDLRTRLEKLPAEPNYEDKGRPPRVRKVRTRRRERARKKLEDLIELLQSCIEKI